MSVALMDDDRERLEVWAALVRATPQKQFWVKAEAAAKSAGEFVAGIFAIVAVSYGLSWIMDDIFVHIHVDHRWLVYRAWHAWWWVIVPLVMVGIGWPFRRRALGGGFWAVGAIWMIFIGWAAGMLLFMELRNYVNHRLGFLVGTALSLVAVLLLGVCFAVGARLVRQVRKELGR